MLHERVCEKCLSYMLNDELRGWLKCPACSFMKKEKTSMISAKEVLMGRAELQDLPEDLQKNLEDLLIKLNKFRALYGKPMYVSSGYRPPDVNKAAGGGSKSAHLTLQACDFSDKEGSIFEFIKNNPDVLKQCGLYMEDPRWTKTWVHLQTRPASKQIFLPYADGRDPPAPERKID
jgi:zinc D-Ala-D-Ala carboxypeptidase